MTKRFQVGALVISHTKTLAMPYDEHVSGRPALVIDTRRTGYPHWWQSLRLKVGDIEWWDAARFYEKVPE
jgi:hypothetical protein